MKLIKTQLSECGICVKYAIRCSVASRWENNVI